MKLIGVHEKPGYFELRIEGDFNVDEFGPIGAAAKEIADRVKDARLLLHCATLTGEPPTMLQRFRVSAKFLDLPGTVKVAMLAPTRFIDPERFGERVAQNRGLWTRVFDDEAQAIEWLLDDSPGTGPPKRL